MTTEQQQHAAEQLRSLEAMGFDTKALWRDLAERIDRAERGTPDDDDRRYELPTVPPRPDEHFVEGENQLLSPGVLWQGFSYSLTRGQRGWLRDECGLAGARTLTVEWVETWPGTRHPRAMKVRSDLHVNSRLRKNVHVEAVIRNVGRFFREAKERDAAEATGVVNLLETSLKVGQVVKLDSYDRWAIEDLTGVKVRTEVEITGVGPERFVVMCTKTGNVAKVPQKEFFETVAEYTRLYADPKTKKKGALEPAPALDALVKQLLKDQALP